MSSLKVHFGGLKVVRPLGSGNSTKVYHVADPEGKEWVIKPLGTDKSISEGVREEVEKLRQLSLPNVVPIHDLITDHGQTFLRMKYLEGESIDSFCRRAPRPRADRLQKLLAEVVSALDKMHKSGIVHRDLRPSNIIVNGGRALVMDYCVPMSHQQTARPHYLAPELRSTTREGSPKGDIYSLGVLLRELITANGVTENNYRSLWTAAEACINEDPRARPSASEVLQLIGTKEVHPDTLPDPSYAERRKHDLLMQHKTARLAANMTFVLLAGTIAILAGLGMHLVGSNTALALLVPLVLAPIGGIAFKRTWGERLVHRIAIRLPQTNNRS